MIAEDRNFIFCATPVKHASCIFCVSYHRSTELSIVNHTVFYILFYKNSILFPLQEEKHTAHISMSVSTFQRMEMVLEKHSSCVMWGTSQNAKFCCFFNQKLLTFKGMSMWFSFLCLLQNLNGQGEENLLSDLATSPTSPVASAGHSVSNHSKRVH